MKGSNQITLPNSLDNFILIEMCERLKNGHVVTMLFGGRSMLPLINGTGDKIQLRPVTEDEACVCGEVYLFRHQGHFVIHRLLRIKDRVYHFRGDNCYAYEHVERANILAKLIAIEKTDGTMVDCESNDWRRQSRRVLCKRKVKDTILWLKTPQARKRWAVAYFILLAILMWAPLNGMATMLNNYIFGLRADHFLHAAVYLLCPLFLADWLDKRFGWVLTVALLIGFFTETVQAILPYRGFDVNDLVANCVGNLVGWLAILPFMIKHRRIMKQRIVS